jgi:phage-related protein
MALTIEELQVIIAANSASFNKVVDDVSKQLEGLNKTSNGISKAVGSNLFGSLVGANVVGNAFNQTINKTVNLFKDLSASIIDNGSQYSRLKIATDTVTQNLGISKQAVDGLRDSLIDANVYGVQAENVIKTLALSGLYKMAQSLQTVDARTGNVATGVNALVLTMKDLSAAAGIASDEGIDRLTKFIRRGEATFADGVIEIGNLNLAYQDYAKSMNKSLGDVTAEERAQVRLNIVMHEGVKTFGAYANTMLSSGKIFESVKMRLEAISTVIGAALEPVLTVAGNAFFQFLGGLLGALTVSADSIRAWATNVAGILMGLVRIIGRIFSSLPILGPGFQKLANFTLSASTAQGKLSSAIGGTAGAMDDAMGSAKALNKELMGLASFDEMNVLTPNKDSGGAGGSGADSGLGGLSIGGGATDIGLDLAKINDIAGQTTNSFDELSKKIKEAIKPIQDITIFGIPLTDILAKIAKWIGIVGIAFTVARPILAVFGAVIGAITSPVALAIAAIGGLIAIGISLYQHSENVRKVMDGLATTIKDVLVTAWNVLSEAVSYAWNNIIQPAIQWFQANIVPVLEVIGQKIQEMAAIFAEKFPAIQAAVQPLVDAIGTFLAGAFQFLGQVIDWLWKTILKPLVDFVLANIVPAFSAAIDVLNVLIGIFSQVAAAVLDVVMPVLQGLWDIFTTVFDAIKQIVEVAWEKAIKPIFQALSDFVTKFLIPVFQNLWNMAQFVWNGIKQVVENAWNGIMNAIRPVIDWINTNIMPVINRLKEQFDTVWSGIRSGVEGVWNGITNTIKRGINGIIGLINGFIDQINSAIQGFSDLATSVPGGQPITFRVGHIPYLAKGGAVSSPTLAYLGENNMEEAVLPLDRNTGWAEKIAELINTAGGGKGQQVIVLNVGGEKIFEKTIDFINDQAAATGRVVLDI